MYLIMGRLMIETLKSDAINVCTSKGSFLSASTGTGEAMPDKLKDAFLSFSL